MSLEWSHAFSRRFYGNLLIQDIDRVDGIKLEDRAWVNRHIRDVEVRPLPSNCAPNTHAHAHTHAHTHTHTKQMHPTHTHPTHPHPPHMCIQHTHVHVQL